MAKLGGRQILTLTLTLLVLVALGVGGYLLYPKLISSQQQNSVQLEKFGLLVMPGHSKYETTTQMGITQLPATFSEADLTPEERVVEGLIRDRNTLIEENQLQRLEIETLQRKIAELEDYKVKNRRYSPELLNEELERVLYELKQRLRAMPETERYSQLMLDLMAIAAQQEYLHIVRSRDLILDETRKSIIVNRYLPSYAFCIGNALSLAANNSDELRAIANWLVDPRVYPLPEPLQADLDIVLPPCQQSFRQAMQETLNNAVGG